MAIQERLQTIRQFMLRAGSKMTAQREAIIRVLLECEEAQLSAEDIYMRVKKLRPEIGLATVYRNMEKLAELRIVGKINFGDGVTRFLIREVRQKHMPHHLICTRCSRVKKIKDDWLVNLEERVEREYGFQVIDHRLDFMGSYRNCVRADCPGSGRRARQARVGADAPGRSGGGMR